MVLLSTFEMAAFALKTKHHSSGAQWLLQELDKTGLPISSKTTQCFSKTTQCATLPKHLCDSH